MRKFDVNRTIFLRCSGIALIVKRRRHRTIFLHFSDIWRYHFSLQDVSCELRMSFADIRLEFSFNHLIFQRMLVNNFCVVSSLTSNFFNKRLTIRRDVRSKWNSPYFMNSKSYCVYLFFFALHQIGLCVSSFLVYISY